MSVDSVRTFLSTHAPDIAILEADTSTATVALAAAAHNVAPGQIAKTLAFWLKEGPILVVMRGDARIDNQKFKARFGTKAKMLDSDAVLQWTSHPVGGVCPFGLPQPLRVFADVSMRQYAEVVPAAGSTTTALRIAPDRLATLVDAQWIDVGQAPTASNGDT